MTEILVPKTYRTKYGINWPIEASDTQIEMVCAKHWREPLYASGNLLSDPGEHLINACQLLFTPDEFTVHKWAREHAHIWCVDDFAIIWGAAACSKSNNFGLFTLVDWLTDPLETLAIVASTSKEMLQLRSFEAILRYHTLLKRRDPRTPGISLRQPLGIVNQESTGAAATTLKAAIKGVAVQAGSEAEARANLQGGHLPYVRLLLDELSAMKRAAVEARNNLSVGAENFKLFGLCNPESIYDLAGQYSVPKKGWGSVNLGTHEWETQWGKVYHYDGFESPAVKETNGARKYPFLIKQSDIDRIVLEHNGNLDAPQVYTYVRGWPPPQGVELTVLTETMIVRFSMRDTPIWEQDKVVVAGLDPAFTSGGDGCILQVAEVGVLKDGAIAIGFIDEIPLEIQASSPTPTIYQIAEQVKRYAEEFGFTPEMLAVDESGTQSVCDVLDREWAPGALRVVGSSRASDLPVSMNNLAPSKEYYRNRTTELWYTLRNFGELGQIRGLPDGAARQFCMRRIKSLRPMQLESKDDYKTRMKKSPDEADACALVMAVVRERLGLQPGATKFEPGGPASSGFELGNARNYDIDANDDNYLVDSYGDSL